MMVLCQHDNIGLTAYICASTAIGKLIYTALSTLYLFPKHKKKEAESIICFSPLLLFLLSLRQKNRAIPKFLEWDFPTPRTNGLWSPRLCAALLRRT